MLALRRAGITLATAESLTGGLVAQMLRRSPARATCCARGYVAYHDDAKRRDLGVSADLLARHGAVSAEVAGAMAEGARARAGTEAALATTGVAGPADVGGPGGTIAAGTFYVAAALEGAPTRVLRHHIPLERPLVQRRAALAALDLLRRVVLGLPDPGR